MRRIPAKLLSPFLRFFVKHYFKKPRSYRYKDLKIKVFPTVFFPHFTISTKLLLEFLETEKIENLNFLELGCGTGIISCFAAKKGANVVASDINDKALENALYNATKNNVKIQAMKSDLFTDLKKFEFDYIVINPPYYPKDPENDAEKAWFCGKDFAYFKNLFDQLSKQKISQKKVVMILSEDCDIENIQNLALRHNISLVAIKEQKRHGELNYIFQLISSNVPS
ncbi:MAG: methyltransferase [Crocinitomicaceae bacterium]